MENKPMFTNRFNFKANYITFLSEKNLLVHTKLAGKP